MIRVMIVGLPGKMATLVAKAVEETAGMELMSIALAEEEGKFQLGMTNISLVPLLKHESTIRDLQPDIVVDFTVPDAVNGNAKMYCDCKVPFVMGTTGGDRELLKKTVEQSKVCAVIAPNMAKQIVVFQAMMEYAAKTFPDSFREYRLMITESHQQGKKDTSGTAKAMVQYFKELGIPFEVDQIVMVRDPEVQAEELGVPAQYLVGHGWHTYTLLSEDETVLFRFTHNVNGRNIYVRGVLDAIRFLDEKVQEEAQGIVFSMISVLKG